MGSFPTSLPEYSIILMPIPGEENTKNPIFQNNLRNPNETAAK